MNLKWIDECIGDRKSWVLRDMDDGGAPRASINHIPESKTLNLPDNWSLVVRGVSHVGTYLSLEEAQAVGTMLAPLPHKEKAAYKTVINRLN